MLRAPGSAEEQGGDLNGGVAVDADAERLKGHVVADLPQRVVRHLSPERADDRQEPDEVARSFHDLAQVDLHGLTGLSGIQRGSGADKGVTP